jgi:phosphopentomutase
MTGKPAKAGVNIGVRETFGDLAATIADVLGVKRPLIGTSFKADILA